MKIRMGRKKIIILIMVNFLILGMYYSYAIFVTKQIQENVAVLLTSRSSLKIDSSSLINNKLTVPLNSSKEITINLLNNLGVDVYYQLLHEGVPTGVGVYYSSFVGKFLKAGNETTTKVTIINNLAQDVEVTFYCQASLTSDFDKELGYSYINQELNYDHSGANSPSISGLGEYFPVFYEKISNTEGVWKIADKNNNNSEAIWYDYDNGRWANMVLVEEESRLKYNNVGVAVDELDILAFFVWVPAFKYRVVNSDSLTSYEKDLDVIFISENASGTVTCTDDISNSHLYSEICLDNKYQNVYNNLSTYRHPAFSFNNNKTKGLWVGKFQTSHNGTMIIPNAIPTTVKYEVAFKYAREYELVNNPYGLVASGTYLKTNGMIDKDNNIFDTHVLTNMEWGALAILSSSLYGKSGNSHYYTDDNYTYKRIYVNNYTYDNRTGCSSNYSTFSNSFITGESSACISYNNLNDYTHTSNSLIQPIGEIGPGASTTGTIYGVYDMVGGTQEMVSALTANEGGIVNTSISDIYYDLYSYNDYLGVINSWHNAKNIYRYKLGDGIREHYRSIMNNGMWYSGNLEQSVIEGYFVRGGTYNSGANASIYSSNVVDINAVSAFRVAISIVD